MATKKKNPRLTTIGRMALPPEAFLLPKKRMFPAYKKRDGNLVIDVPHVRTAIGRATISYRAGNITKAERDAVQKKARALLKRRDELKDWARRSTVSKKRNNPRKSWYKVALYTSSGTHIETLAAQVARKTAEAAAKRYIGKTRHGRRVHKAVVTGPLTSKPAR